MASQDSVKQVVIVGGGSAGISVATSLLKRKSDLDITIIDPAGDHYYQPGFTLVGGGVFTVDETRRSMASVMPKKVNWIQSAVATFDPDNNSLALEDGSTISYERLIVCPGLKLDWDAVEGLRETLGKNGVTSNYLSDYAPYTWELVEQLESGKAIFTQPPMPIKCAGAPQKVLYLSADQWLQKGRLKNINISFYNAGPVLFGVADYVPALQSYMDKYGVALEFSQNLVKVDGPNKTAWFSKKDSEGNTETVSTTFDMLHVCPPQTAPDFIRSSPLADAAGWVDVDKNTLKHNKYGNVWGLGDATNSPNAKTAAAIRKQAPVVASNVLQDMANSVELYGYDGYGACPLTVERGKIVLAEFRYGGKLAPTLPTWLLQGTQPTWLAWFLKKVVMPKLYWDGMLKGKETLVAPVKLKDLEG
ncbi:NAD(P)/FAD-dependent oxidoreductase [Gammaproteobacteria bacterium]|nr:NAD(P)/FAD-dependent oxidoreductase [Gammaproteobacteria bacterium]